eukprot:6459759-Amphidinium_carterae.1
MLTFREAWDSRGCLSLWVCWSPLHRKLMTPMISQVAELSWSGDGTVRLVRKSSGDHLRFAVQSLIS